MNLLEDRTGLDLQVSSSPRVLRGTEPLLERKADNFPIITF
jgi:hypothetical protein